MLKKDVYNGTECYVFETRHEEEYVEKDTGLCILWMGDIATKYVDTELSLKYSFETVTDEDISKPDFTQYAI